MQLLQREWVCRRPLARQPASCLCYFSCESYFRYLYCALHSLGVAAAGMRVEVLLFQPH